MDLPPGAAGRSPMSVRRSSRVSIRATARVSVSDRLDEMQDGHALLARDHVERLDEPQRMRVGEQRAPGQVGAFTICGLAAIEQGRETHAERPGDLVESARTDAVGAVLVFLDLLERHPEMIAELGL